jgi:hypothetical protein
MAVDQRVGGISKRIRVRKIRAFCARCKHKQSFERVSINHLLHFLLTLLSAGLWSVSWVAHTIGMYYRPWRCKHCGWRNPKIEE